MSRECAGCPRPLYGRTVRDALGQLWHAACAALEAEMSGARR